MVSVASAQPRDLAAAAESARRLARESDARHGAGSSRESGSEAA